MCFASNASDNNQILDPADISWFIQPSSQAFAQGFETSRVFDVGNYNILARVSDEQNASAEDSISINVAECTDTPPVVSILQPAQDSLDYNLEYIEDGADAQGWFVNVDVIGGASDQEDGVLSDEQLIWRTNRSDLQGSNAPLATGQNATLKLYGGNCLEDHIHEVRLEATDSDGNTRSAIRRLAIFCLPN